MPAQFADVQRVVAIDPVQATGKVWGANLAPKLRGCHALILTFLRFCFRDVMASADVFLFKFATVFFQ
jgi:hypothetical protein